VIWIYGERGDERGVTSSTAWVRLTPWRGWKGAVKEIQRGEKASIYVEARGKGIAEVLPDEE
jgi:hypothetical protein